tara:strand:- start:622 stop:1185 length:564 start_codon:yes stop_codon:yes gene_type:complete
VKSFPTKYHCLKQQVFEFQNFKITPIRYKDRYEIMNWRNDQIFLLRQGNLLTQKKQDLYFESIIANEFDLEKPNQILFSFFKNKKLIGYGGLVHIDWINQNAEISFLLKTDLNNLEFYTQGFTTFLKLIQKLGLNINMHKIYTYGYKTNEYRFLPLINSFFEKEVELKMHKKINDNWFDVLIYSKFL